MILQQSIAPSMFSLSPILVSKLITILRRSSHPSTFVIDLFSIGCVQMLISSNCFWERSIAPYKKMIISAVVTGLLVIITLKLKCINKNIPVTEQYRHEIINWLSKLLFPTIIGYITIYYKLKQQQRKMTITSFSY